MKEIQGMDYYSVIGLLNNLGEKSNLYDFQNRLSSSLRNGDVIF